MTDDKGQVQTGGYGFKRTYVMPLLVLTVICLVVSGALALMHTVTDPIVVSAAAERAQVAMSYTIPNATGFVAVDTSGIEGIPSTIREIYKASNDVGYIFIAAVGGFSGDVTVICGLDNDGMIISTSTLSHTETRGIGTIIEQESFLDPFSGLDNRLSGIDTVTGATITTRAFIHAIEDVCEAFEVVRG